MCEEISIREKLGAPGLAFETWESYKPPLAPGTDGRVFSVIGLCSLRINSPIPLASIHPRKQNLFGEPACLGSSARDVKSVSPG